MVGVSKTRSARSDQLSVLMRIRVWIMDHFSIFFTTAEWSILGDFLPFRIESPADFPETWRHD